MTHIGLGGTHAIYFKSLIDEGASKMLQPVQRRIPHTTHATADKRCRNDPINRCKWVSNQLRSTKTNNLYFYGQN